MDRKEIPVSEIIRIRPSSVTDDQIRFFWYDWFCSDSSLKNKGRSLLGRLRAVAKNTRRFNPEKTYVFFKNNCGKRLYDDFRVCDIKTGDVLYTVIPKWTNGKSVVWGRDNDFAEPIVEGSWDDVKRFFSGTAV